MLRFFIDRSDIYRPAEMPPTKISPFLPFSCVIFLCLPVEFDLSGLPVEFQSQPCASRTPAITPRMSFHVFCSIMVAFGNMQPSQQMCRTARVGVPVSSFKQ